MAMKTTDYALIAGGAALVYFLWPKSAAAGAPGISVPRVSMPTSVPRSTAPSAAARAGQAAVDATDLYQAQAQMTPDELYQSIVTQGLQGYGTTLIDLPGDMVARASEVDQQIRQVMADVDANRAALPSSTGDSWDLFVKEWEHFTQQDQGPGRGWLYGTGIGDWWTAAGVSMDSINQRAQALIDWRTRLTQYIGALSSPAPAPPPPPTDPFGLSKLGSYLPWIVGGLAIIYLGPALARSLSKKGSTT